MKNNYISGLKQNPFSRGKVLSELVRLVNLTSNSVFKKTYLKVLEFSVEESLNSVLKIPLKSLNLVPEQMYEPV